MPRPNARADVFRAVADPTRRAALEVLARRPELPVTELAEQLAVGLPMLSRHLAVLRDAGLVRQQQSGRQRLYSIDPEPLRELYDWAALFNEFWQERITGLRAYLDRQQTGESDRAT
ncbi:MAG: metalloregulator ArsR/SmtB family transcription factor [Kibdelosporangium sp.]